MSEKEADRIQPEANVTATTNQEPEVVENFLGGPINWEALRYAQGDLTGTSGYGVLRAAPQMPGRNSMAMIGWLNICKRKDLDPKETLLKGIEPLQQNVTDYNSFKHLFGHYDAQWAISIGKYLNQMKKLAKRAGYMWEPWAAENLPFIGETTRSKYMRLANRTDCHRYSLLGMERLDHLCRAVKFSKDSDNIGELLQRHNIEFDPTKEFELNKFKDDVDAALNSEKLLDQGIVVDFAVVRDLTVQKVKFDNSLIGKLKTLKEHGGSVDSYLGNLSMNKGSGSKAKEDGLDMKDFNSLSNRLIQTIDEIIEDEDLADEVDTKTLLDLVAKLEALRKVTGPDLTSQVAEA